MFSSVLQERGLVQFPVAEKAEHNYMIPFMQSEGLPRGLTHWQDTVSQMLDGIKTDAPIYFMSDTKFVLEGDTHRRPGVHVDGYWVPDLLAHGGGGHSGGGRGGHGGRTASGSWDSIDFSSPEALILASNMTAARAYTGEFEGPIGEGGDCTMIPLTDLNEAILHSHRVYCGTVSTLHESLPVPYSGWRTLVRLNCPSVKVH